MNLSFLVPGPKLFPLCLSESKQLCYWGRRCQTHTHVRTHMHTHTNSQSRGARNKGINEWVYVRSVCGREMWSVGSCSEDRPCPTPTNLPQQPGSLESPGGWYSKGLWVSVTVMIKKSNAERERAFQKGRGRAWQTERVLKEEMKPIPSPCLCLWSSPGSQTQFLPSFFAKLK